jgi:hypothetical protein
VTLVLYFSGKIIEDSIIEKYRMKTLDANFKGAVVTGKLFFFFN